MGQTISESDFVLLNNAGHFLITLYLSFPFNKNLFTIIVLVQTIYIYLFVKV